MTSTGLQQQEERKNLVEEFALRIGLACDEGRLEEAKYLLGKAADARRAVLLWRDRLDQTLLYSAVNDGLLTSAKWLVEMGCDVQQSGPGGTLLHRAAARGRLDMVRWLVDQGADIDGRDGKMQTPIMCAILGRHTKVALYLLKAGAQCDAKVRGEHGSVGNYAIACDNPEVCLVLYAAGKFDGELHAPLKLALIYGAKKVIESCMAHPDLRQPAVGATISEELLAVCMNEETRQLLLSLRSGIVIGETLGVNATDGAFKPGSRKPIPPL